MKNQPCYDKNGNFIGWFSRSVAVMVITFARDKNKKLYVLASQRGPGTPDPELVGHWNCCCGYLDFEETTEEAAIRETFEETGIEIPQKHIHSIGWIDDPKKDKRQNISHRFYAMLPKTIEKYSFSKENNEEGEVGDIKWIPISEIGDYKWAFDHDNIIREFLKTRKKKKE